MSDLVGTENDASDDSFDVRNYVDIISTYSCKLCNFRSSNAQSIRQHVEELHLNSKAVTVHGEASDHSEGDTKCGKCIDVNVLVSPSEDVAVIGDVKSGENKTVKLNFICNSCGTAFSLGDIMQHLSNVHGMEVEMSAFGDMTGRGAALVSGSTCIAPEGAAMAPKVTSTGIQAAPKKRGRKRKIVTEEASEEAADGVNHAGSKDSVDNADKGEADNTAVKSRASKMLEISRLMEDVSNCKELPKRQIRPPKTLVDDYHVIHPRHWKRNAAYAAEQKLQCAVEGCGATFSSEKGLEYHAMCHANGDEESSCKFCCPECAVTFATWIELRVHLLESHDITVDQFYCDTCDFRAETASLLEEHNLAVHSLETNPDSEYTPKGSGMKRSRRPRNTVPKEGDEATSNEDSECPECKRKFADQKSMNRHIEVTEIFVLAFLFAFLARKSYTFNCQIFH
jgi:hypothetical protein